jgi:hypothetical protein
VESEKKARKRSSHPSTSASRRSMTSSIAVKGFKSRDLKEQEKKGKEKKKKKKKKNHKKRATCV